MGRLLGWISIMNLVVACTTTQGARPHDMSAAQHEMEGQKHERLAETYGGPYDPSSVEDRTRCLQRGGQKSAGVDTGMCWTSVLNPTPEYLRVAEKHRRQAADHRAASVALRDAEAHACIGISADDRDMSPFNHIEDIESVAPFMGPVSTGKVPTRRMLGAVVTFRAIPGMTAEWLQRVIDCHLARNASLGHMVAEMPNCPLVPNGVQVSVTSTGNGFSVMIRSDDSTVAREILDRAERLRSGSVNR